MSLLEVSDLNASYGPVQVLRGVSFSLDEGQAVAILGPNGAGKTTTLRALCGMVPTEGTVKLDGEEITGTGPEGASRLGIAQVPEGRGTFAELTVEENLRLGAFLRDDRGGIREDMERYYGYFPVLRDRAKQHAGQLSGGEQQMLAVSRALMMRPRVLLLDEPSLGLAPLVTRQLFEVLTRIQAEEKLTMLIVEQNANLALKIAHWAYVLETGEIAFDGPADEMINDERVQRSYLGV